MKTNSKAEYLGKSFKIGQMVNQAFCHIQMEHIKQNPQIQIHLDTVLPVLPFGALGCVDELNELAFPKTFHFKCLLLFSKMIWNRNMVKIHLELL